MFPRLTFKSALCICCVMTPFVARVNHVSVILAATRTSILVFSFWIIYRSLLYPALFSTLRHIPTPSGSLPFIGHAHIIASSEVGVPLRRWHAEHGPIIRFLFPFGSERLSIADDEAIKHVTVRDSYSYVKPSYVQVWMRSILGSGVLLVDGEEHMRQRKALSPAFSTSAVRDLTPTFFSKALLLTRLLIYETRSQGPAAPVEMLEWLNRATLDIIALAGFGYEVDSLRNPKNPLRLAYNSLFAFDLPSRIVMGLRMISPVFALIPSRMNRSMENARNTIAVFSTDIVKSKTKRENKALKDIIALVVRQNQEYRDTQLATNETLSTDTIRQQVMTFLAAGHDTTTTAVAWTLHLLSKRSDMQDRLREEIRTSIPELLNPESIPDSSDLTADVDQLPYLANVCRESLRFIPPIPYTSREAQSDVTLCGHFIPRGTWLYIAANAINHLPSFWGTDPPPDTFNPDRWDNLPQEFTTNSYMTFLHGPRSCIGRKFAETEMKVLLCCLLSVFRFEPDDAFEDQERHKRWLLVMRPRDGMNLKMTLVQ